MHLSRLIFPVVLAGMVWTASATNATALTEGERYIWNIGQAVLAVARNKTTPDRRMTGFRNLIHRHGDIGSIGMFSLGPYRRKLPARLRGEYLKLVEYVIARFFVIYADRFAGRKFDIIRSKRRGARDLIVETKVVYIDEDQPASSVAWRVARRGGGFKVFDIKLLGVWLRLHLRSKFVSVLKQNHGNFKSLLAYMRGK